MRKSVILSTIEKELTKAQRNASPIAEIKLSAHNKQENKDRLAYCILTNHEQFANLQQLVNDNVTTWFEPEVNFYDSINSVKLAHAATMNDALVIENNWRGRLFDYAEVQNKNDDQFRDFLLRSVWRLIIQRDTGLNYYVRHDIYPYFWSPGHSTGGDQVYEEQVISAFWNITEPRFNRADLDFDILKVFTNRDGNKTYSSISFEANPTNNPADFEISLNMSHAQKQHKLDNLITNIRLFFR